MERSVPTFQFGAVTLIPSERVVLRDGRPVPLTPKAFDLLAVLAAHPGRLLTKEELIEAVWPDTVVEESNLTYNVFAIRKALGESADGERYIETVPKRGYRFVAPVEQVGMDGQSIEPAPVSSSALGRSWLHTAVGVAIGATAAAILMQFRAAPAPDRAEAIHFEEAAWGPLALTNITGAWPLFVTSPVSVSPDGRHLAASLASEDGVRRIWVRRINALLPKPLPGTETLSPVPSFWSADGAAIAFDSTGGGALKQVSLAGGAPQKVCDLAGTAVGGSWNRDGVIIVGNPVGGIMRCPATGGRPEQVTQASSSGLESHLFPSFLPDGRHFIYLSIPRANPERSGLYVAELSVGSPAGAKRLFATGFPGSYVPANDSGPGLIVFGRDGALFAQRFDDRRFEMIGEPVQLADRIGSYLDYAYFSVSQTMLVYRAPEAPFQLTWFDRDGRRTGTVGPPERVAGLALSPDGGRALVVRHAPQHGVDQDLWLYDLSRAANPLRMTSAPTLEFFPVWQTNARFLYTSGGGETGVYQQAVDAERELLVNTGFWDIPTSISADGSVMLYTTLRDQSLGADVWMRSAKNTSQDDGLPLISRPFHQAQAQLSPDRRWVAYVSNETGVNEVFVAAFQLDSTTGKATAGNSLLVSKGGGFAPRWRGDGRELFYLKTDGSVIAVEANGAPGFSPSAILKLFDVPGVIPEWGVTRDGRRFFFAAPIGPPPPFNVVRDWQTLLSR